MKQARSLVLTFAALVIITALILALSERRGLLHREHDLNPLLGVKKGLEKRFGEEYLEYKKHVPMWLPCLITFESAGAKKSKVGA